MNEPTKRIYLNQIKRLQERNALLAECLADERAKRKKAYDWYQEKLSSNLWCMIASIFDLKRNP